MYLFYNVSVLSFCLSSHFNHYIVLMVFVNHSNRSQIWIRANNIIRITV